ncbi:MAG: hypothetical protein HF312_13160 [Ignavibacteria bacterium]|jgi:hypothetical protein|nr:hypothetical protein [Ignavibacteria bacterium]MCU7521162.1 hypothetical protein [Ignavibacteria bacterium]
MYYVLKIFSFSPIFNISGEDKFYGDIGEKSNLIRISIVGFTIIYFFTFFSIVYDKKRKRIKFEYFHIVKYPILSITEDQIQEKIRRFTCSIESCDEEALTIKLSVIKDKIEGQQENINHSLVKANVVLAIFIGVLLYFMGSKFDPLLFYNGPVGVKILLVLLTFCYFASCVNLFFFITRLTRVSSYCEVSIPKSNNKHRILNETIIDYYTKFTRNKINSVNQVSYNIWVQDYFKKFIIYGVLILALLSVPSKLYVSDKYLSNTHEIYRSFQLTYRNAEIFTSNISELNNSTVLLDSLKIPKIVMFYQESKINRTRIACLEKYYDRISRTKIYKKIIPVDTELLDGNKIYVITLGCK